MAEADCIEWMRATRSDYVVERMKAGETEEVAHQVADEQYAVAYPNERPAPGHRFFTIELDEAPVGGIWIGPHPQRREAPQYAWLFYIEVAEPHQGRGIGRTALTLLEADLRAEGCTELGLNVFAHNGVARKLYATSGYREAAVTMSKTLDP